MSTQERKLRVLFLDMENSCRSQMAEAWARELKSDVLEARSAGLTARPMDLHAVHVMAQAGVDISLQGELTVEQLGSEVFDCVLAFCGRGDRACPVFPNARMVLCLDIANPATEADAQCSEAEIMDRYRRVRDAIRDYVAGLPDALPKPGTPGTIG